MLMLVVMHWQLHESAYESKYSNFYPYEEFGKMFNGICPDVPLISNDLAIYDPLKFFNVHWQEFW